MLFDVAVDQKRVCFRVDVFHHDLKAVEAACFWDLNLSREAFDEILVDDAVGSSEEGQNVRDEVALIIVQPRIPVVEVFGEVNLFRRPKRRLGFLVHLPNLKRELEGRFRAGKTTGIPHGT